MRNSLFIAVALVLTLSTAACDRATRSASDDGDADRPATGADTNATTGGTGGAAAGTGDAATGGTDSAGGSDQSGALVQGGAAATVNGRDIALADFQRQAFDTQRAYVEQGLDANTEEGQRQLLYLRRQVLDDMINQVLIEQAAAEMAITVTQQEVDERMGVYATEFGGEDAMATAQAARGETVQDLREAEQAQMVGARILERVTADVPTTREFVHARHVLCAAEEDCTAALARIEGGEPFDAVAADVSKDPSSARKGGDLDWISRDMLPSGQLEEHIFNLQPGQRSGVVQTDLGYHVIEVLERDPDREMTQEQHYSLREKRLMEWLAERRAAADIRIHIEDLRELAESS